MHIYIYTHKMETKDKVILKTEIFNHSEVFKRDSHMNCKIPSALPLLIILTSRSQLSDPG